MFFKSLNIYKFTSELKQTNEELEELLAEAAFKDCHSSQSKSIGWSKPLQKYGIAFIHTHEDCVLICQKTEEKIMPSAAINEVLHKRVDAVEKEEQRKLTRKERTLLKEEVVFELLPKALTKRSRSIW